MDIEGNRSALEAWLILLRAPGLGPAGLRELVTRHGSAAAALTAVRKPGGQQGADAAFADWLRSPDLGRIEADLR
jgi:DNA processing protein